MSQDAGRAQNETWDQVFAAELKKLRPPAWGESPSLPENGSSDIEHRLTGLAMSGGGIRSASFSLGVSQALLAYGVMKRFHYLSTVSGGGYTGTAINWLRKLYKKDAWIPHITGRIKEEPKIREGTRQRKANPDKHSLWLDYIRQHGNYLQPPSLGTMSLFSVIARNLMLSIAVYVMLLSVLLTFAKKIKLYGPHSEPYCRNIDAFEFQGFKFNPYVCFDSGTLTLALLLFISLTFVLYSLGSWIATQRRSLTVPSLFLLIPVVISPTWIGLRPVPSPMCPTCDLGRSPITASFLLAGFACIFVAAYFIPRIVDRSAGDDDDSLYKARIDIQKWGGLLLMLASVTVLFALHPLIESFTGSNKIDARLIAVGTAGSLIALIVALGASYRFVFGSQKILPENILVQMRIFCSFLIVLICGISAAYLISRYFAELPNSLVYAIALATFVVAFCTNLNQFGIGRMYRDRLMETFMPDKETIQTTVWKKATLANQNAGLLTELWTPQENIDQEGYLFPLINTNVVLVDSKDDTYRGRGGDSFALSPLCCGSDATGWVRTSSFAGGTLKSGTAMAISGAAANPNTAPGGVGYGRNRFVSFLMFLSQARLGAWIRNPSAKISLKYKLLSFFIGDSPNFIHPGLKSGLVGIGLHEKAYFLELTDGGHFDNCGIYELIRRKVRLIVLSQASQDAAFGFADLANACEKIRVDFDVTLDFSEGIPLDGVLPKLSSGSQRPGTADRGHAVARIHYGGGSFGWLVYLQATPLENLQVDLHSYHFYNRAFPNEPTANQFFREAQLEAYRELGQITAERFLEKVIESQSTGSCPSTMCSWEHTCLSEIYDILRPVSANP